MNRYVIAKYIRLSQDDAVSDSLSISHQRLILDSHIEELDIPNAEVIEFVDNGYTGTNTDRPGFQDMIDRVRCGRVNCIVTKDFSRFARNAIESGYYIEQVFPLFRIRFIAVNEGFDSRDYKDGTGGMDMAFKFLLNDYYSTDLSRKIKSAVHTRMRNGEKIAACAIYGYRKKSCGKWEFDPIAAEVIRDIFRMALDGMTTAQIRDKLFADRCLAPREYEYINKGKDITPKYGWSSRQIWRILNNEQYMGTYIAGKGEVIRVGSRTRIEKDKSEWTIIPNNHPPIVSREDFARVQGILHPMNQATAVKSKRIMKPRDYLLRGKIVCGTCGYAMVYSNPTTQRVFRCMKTHADKKADCHKMMVSSAEVDDAVMTIIRKQAEAVLACDDLMSFRKTSDNEWQMTAFEKQISQLAEQRQQCYERFLALEIDRDTFQSLKSDYTTQIDRLNNQLALLKQTERDKEVQKKTAALADIALNKAATPRDIVDALVEKVLVFPGNHIEIRWKFVDFVANL
jgi:DNA invertase Pin-like site-specific DNA recombinase